MEKDKDSIEKVGFAAKRSVFPNNLICVLKDLKRGLRGIFLYSNPKGIVFVLLSCLRVFKLSF